MSIYQDVKDTIDSPGMKWIAAELKRRHRKAYLEYRNCGTMEQVFYLQIMQKVIDTELPKILNDLMNRHVDKKLPPKHPDWWRFDQWIKQLFR